jgi:hypothetical protein
MRLTWVDGEDMILSTGSGTPDGTTMSEAPRAADDDDRESAAGPAMRLVETSALALAGILVELAMGSESPVG